MDKNVYIKTDNEIVINIQWISSIQLIDDCFKFKTSFNNIDEYQVCKNKNLKYFDMLYNKLQFSKK
jgi:hypothetical protein